MLKGTYRNRIFLLKISLRSWLFGTARRVASDFRRGLRRHERRIQAFAVVHNHQPRERVAERAEAADFVQRFLDSLDQDKRMVFILADLEGFTAPEISQWLREAGFENPRTMEVPAPSPLILATKPK